MRRGPVPGPVRHECRDSRYGRQGRVDRHQSATGFEWEPTQDRRSEVSVQVDHD